MCKRGDVERDLEIEIGTLKGLGSICRQKGNQAVGNDSLKFKERSKPLKKINSHQNLGQHLNLENILENLRFWGENREGGVN